MKNKLILLTFLSALVTACGDPSIKEVDLIGEEEIVHVKLRFGGDLVTFSDRPLNGRVAEGHSEEEVMTYYGVYIRDFESGSYASGVFDHLPEGLTLPLISGRRYSWSVQAIRKGQTFGIKVENNRISRNSGSWLITNSLYFDGPGFLNADEFYVDYYDVQDSTSYSSQYSVWVPLKTEHFYGGGVIETDNISEGSELLFELQSQNFATEISVSGLHSGRISVLLGTHPTTRHHLIYEEDVEGDMNTYAYSEFLRDTYRLSIIHRDTIYSDSLVSVPISTTLFSDDVHFQANYIKSIHITAPENAEGVTREDHGFSIILQDEELIQGDTIVVGGS